LCANTLGPKIPFKKISVDCSIFMLSKISLNKVMYLDENIDFTTIGSKIFEISVVLSNCMVCPKLNLSYGSKPSHSSLPQIYFFMNGMWHLSECDLLVFSLHWCPMSNLRRLLYELLSFGFCICMIQVELTFGAVTTCFVTND
jgi:hypothetical protein